MVMNIYINIMFLKVMLITVLIYNIMLQKAKTQVSDQKSYSRKYKYIEINR